MENALAHSNFLKLPAEMQAEVIDFIDFLLSKQDKKDTKHSGLTPDQEAILEERLGKYEKGEMKFSTWDEVENRIISKAKNAI